MPQGVMPPEQLPTLPWQVAPMIGRARVAGARPREGELRPVAVDAAVVRRALDDVPRAVAVARHVQEAVADRVLLDLDLRRRLVPQRRQRLEPVLVERPGVLVVDEEDALVAVVVEREERQEVVVEPEGQRHLVAVQEGVAPRDQHLHVEARRHLERVRREAAMAVNSESRLLRRLRPCFDPRASASEWKRSTPGMDTRPDAAAKVPAPAAAMPRMNVRRLVPPSRPTRGRSGPDRDPGRGRSPRPRPAACPGSSCAHLRVGPRALAARALPSIGVVTRRKAGAGYEAVTKRRGSGGTAAGTATARSGARRS